MTDHIGETNEKVDKRMTDHAINEAVAQKLGWFDTDYVGGATPDYCHSIGAAWEIALQMAQEKTACGLINRPNGNWVCKMLDFEAEADTASKAICLAFLRLKETP